MAKKIIICSPQLGISPQSNLGGEVYDREIIKSLGDLGVRVIVILPKNKPYLPHKNLKVYYLPFPFVWPPFLFNILIIPWLFWLHKKEKFGFLRIHSPYFVGPAALFFKLFHPQIPLVTTYHHLEDKNFFFHLINKIFINFWNHIICVSKFTKKELIQRYNCDQEKISVIYNGIENKFRAKDKRKDLIKKYNLKNKKTLLFLGGLRMRKNIDFLLRVIKDLDYSNFKLVICGGGNFYQRLVNQTKRWRIEDKVIFTGFIPEDEKVDYYNLADIFLYPSIKEGFGLSVIEAAACGVPSVVSDVSSLKELVLNGKTGYLAKLNNLNDWKRKVERLLNNDSLRKKMGQSAHKFSQNFSWQKCVQKQMKIYKELLTINH